jgi:hypothetical protein
MLNERQRGSLARASANPLAWNWVIACFVGLTLPLCHGCSSQGAPSGKVGGGDPKEQAESARIVVEKTMYDLGQIKPGSINSATFHLTNAGVSVLRITDIKKCCGTTVEIEKMELRPGESTVLLARYNAPMISGDVSKRIELVTNDPASPTRELTITGRVIQTLTWTPSQFKLSVHGETVNCPEIVIKSLDGTAFSVKGFAATGHMITADFDPNQKATKFTLRPTVSTAKLRALTTASCSIAVDLDHPDYKTVTVPFEVIQPLQATPLQVFVFKAKVGEPVAKMVQVQDNEADPNTASQVAVASVTAKYGSRVEVRSVAPTNAGCNLNLEIWPARGKESEAFSSDQLVVKLKDGREVTVPLRVFFQSPTVSSTAGSAQ